MGAPRAKHRVSTWDADALMAHAEASIKMLEYTRATIDQGFDEHIFREALKLEAAKLEAAKAEAARIEGARLVVSRAVAGAASTSNCASRPTGAREDSMNDTNPVRNDSDGQAGRRWQSSTSDGDRDRDRDRDQEAGGGPALTTQPAELPHAFPSLRGNYESGAVTNRDLADSESSGDQNGRDDDYVSLRESSGTDQWKVHAPVARVGRAAGSDGSGIVGTAQRKLEDVGSSQEETRDRVLRDLICNGALPMPMGRGGGSEAAEEAQSGSGRLTPELAPSRPLTPVSWAGGYDASTADRAYRAGRDALESGDAHAAVEYLQLAASSCPPDRLSALGKIQRLIEEANHEIRMSSISNRRYVPPSPAVVPSSETRVSKSHNSSHRGGNGRGWYDGSPGERSEMGEGGEEENGYGSDLQTTYYDEEWDEGRRPGEQQQRRRGEEVSPETSTRSSNLTVADRAYRAGVDALSNGNAILALRHLQVAASACPADRRSAIAKIKKLVDQAHEMLDDGRRTVR
ncbi:hypothetical protein CBR_g48861 [Chara braunii]|uniref:Uncharacterized protein n=1 Tax=Chara braunii TaxID=69332 RepID=A0A388M3K4_CHABU|nr:hypothetical protein CBR_g48861 [Chara braunii]|eukprot:GBG89154.1 hypothetical protein CBR_g48861 [Chara braunii]